MSDDERRRELIARGRNMSAADLSILQAVLAQARNESALLLTTAAGSRNDVFWSEMAALGWLIDEGALDAVPGTRLFKVAEASKPEIARFLADLDHGASMTRIINELRQSIAPQLIAAVRDVDGTPADLAILVAGIVESTMRRALKPELHDEFLREVAKLAENMRSL